MKEFGTHIQVAKWLENSTYRTIVHRHDDTYIAADQCEGLFIRADTIPLLADSLMNWPNGASKLPKTKYMLVEDRE